MAPNVLSLANRIAYRSLHADWTNTELAELYRVEHALVQARISVETERGVTDEGDPWFVFCRADGEVVVHITRFGGCYRLYSPALPKALVGPTFSALTKTFLGGLRAPIKSGEGVSIHPAAWLSVLIAAIFFSIDFHSSAAHAAEAVGHGVPEQPPPIAQGPLPARETVFHTLVVNLKAFIDAVTPWDSQQSAMLAAVENAAIAAMSPLAGLAENVMNVSVTPAIAETQVSQAAANDSFWQDALKTSGAAQADVKSLFAQAGILSDHQDDVQSAGAHTQNSALSWQGNRFAVPPGIASTTINAEMAALPAAGLSSITDGGQQQGVGLLIAGGPLLVPASAQPDVASAGNSELGDQSAFASPNDTIQVNLAQGLQAIDLSLLAGAPAVDVSGNGALRINGVNGGQQIDVSTNSSQTLSLFFAPKTHAAATIQLNGHDFVTLATVSANADASSDTIAASTGAAGSTSINLTFDSDGSAANVVTIANDAVSSTTKLAITVVGVQDLTLIESAQTFKNSDINSAGLNAALIVSLDLGNVFQSVDLSHVSASNFIVGDSGNIALLDAASGSHIQLGSDLNIVDLSIASAAATNGGALAVDLRTSTANAVPISVNLLDAFSTASLTINSAGAGPGEANTIGTLTDSKLTTLTVTGDSGLTIGALNGPSANDTQNITIDAHALTGALVLDVGGIADTTIPGRPITITAGAGTSVLTNDTVSESTTFVAGTGIMTVNLGGGATHDGIVGLTSTDSVNVGSPAYTDMVINEASVGPEQVAIDHQTTIDHQTNVTAAAQLAASFAASTIAHQALLFSYDGTVYVFVDASGNHSFDASTDAIIKLVGLSATADLAGVFHSA
ncbi:MAG TPA: hypothetical protein VJ728_08915 [Candidatus Binataceae bacterium]|nr:hypothetical protein [Candidatus Binataceae bacterium]